ncbi:Conserved hypothetical protein [Seminavis robusta]|uniref:Uncharacterized protein n=1 Tax=Seminavis robusta TaxID=568900 RepID=A0A9N8HK27_9STRA|nr:Conserved hypothetical protein [Seminavis robusta]|eukprot:Sro588_g171560.1 Conserved hypothetical protein (1036) ;mRNA; r:42401-45701
MLRVIPVLLLLVQLLAIASAGTVRGVQQDGITTVSLRQRRLMKEMGGKDTSDDEGGEYESYEEEEEEEYEEEEEEEEEYEEAEYESVEESKKGGMQKGGMAGASVPKGSMMAGESESSEPYGGMMSGASVPKGSMNKGMTVSATVGTMGGNGKSGKAKGQPKDAKKQKKVQDMAMMNKLAKEGYSGAKGGMTSMESDSTDSVSKKGSMGGGVKGGMKVSATVGSAVKAGGKMEAGAKSQPKDAGKKQKKTTVKTMMNKLAMNGGMVVEGSGDEPAEPFSVEEPMPTDAPTFSDAPPGSDRDEYGCIPSAGYTWCPELEECISFADECPVDGEEFEGPTTIVCDADMRCSVSEECTIDMGDYTIGGPYITGIEGALELPEGCDANCLGCSEEESEDPEEISSPDPEEISPDPEFPTFAPVAEIEPTMAPSFPDEPVVETAEPTPVMDAPEPTAAPTILEVPVTPGPTILEVPEMPAPTFPIEETTAPTFGTEIDLPDDASLVLVNFTLQFGFFADAIVTEPTDDDLDALTVQVEMFYTDLLANTSDDFFAFEAFVADSEFDEDAVFPVTVHYEGVAIFEGEEAPSAVELLSAMEAGDYQKFITDYVWEANSVLFFDTQSVFFTSALDDGPIYQLPTVGPEEPEIPPSSAPLEETDAPTVASTAAETDAPTVASTAAETEEREAETDAPEVPVDTDAPGLPVVTDAPETDPPAPDTEAPVVETDAPETEPPVEETDAPETEPPAVETDAPETEPPAEDTDAPIEVTDAPETEIPAVLPEPEVTEPPLVVTEPPLVATDGPIEVTEAPMEETGAPVLETEAPMEVTEAPMEVTEAPMEVTDAPELPEPDVTEPPLVVTEPPLVVTEPPAEETGAPAEVTGAPEEGEATETPDDGMTGAPEGIMTLPAEVEEDSSRVLQASMDFGFFEGTEVRQPTPEEVDGLVVQINNFYTDVLDESFENFATFEANVVNTTFFNETVGVDFDAFAFFEPGTEAPSPFEVLSVMESGDYTEFITAYVWNVTMDSIFYQTQSVQFYARI